MAERVAHDNMPDIPTLLILSDGTVQEGWEDYANTYASCITDATIVQLDCGHSIYLYEPDECEKAMREFFNKLEI